MMKGKSLKNPVNFASIHKYLFSLNEYSYVAIKVKKMKEKKNNYSVC